MGSAAMGGDVPGVSDLDVWALVRGPVADDAKQALVAASTMRRCPARRAGWSWWSRASRAGRSRSSS